ncbi:MAG: hypothetical protein ACLQVI_03935 [Polyangiaceae bacterium]
MSETPVPPPPAEAKPESGLGTDAPSSAARAGLGPDASSSLGSIGSASPPRGAGMSSRPPMSGGATDALLGGGVDRVARIQTIAAVVLGLALVAIPLYLWRRPRSESLPVTSMLDASAPLSDAGLAVAAASPAAAPTLQVTLSEAKVMECHDTGSKRTRPEDCDHLAAVEKGFAAAITAGGPCLPSANGGGTLVYVLDASFGRKRHPFELVVPKDGRTLKNPHGMAGAVSACSAAVKKGLDGVTLEGVPHAHSRYKIAITATYPPPNGSTP